MELGSDCDYGSDCNSGKCLLSEWNKCVPKEHTCGQYCIAYSSDGSCTTYANGLKCGGEYCTWSA